MRKGGLEPPWVSPPDPKSGASANSATFARLDYTKSCEGFVAAAAVDDDSNPAIERIMEQMVTGRMG